jgi:Rod binding domain-containing protein
MTAIPADVSGLLSGQLGAAGAAAPAGQADAKAVGAEFEGVFLSMLLKQMRQSLDEGFFAGDSGDSFGGMFDLFLGKQLAEASPIGVGDLLTQQYAKNAARDGAESAHAPTATPLSRQA